MSHGKEPLISASRRTRVFAAALTWTGVGIGLAGAGLAWTLRGVGDASAAAGFLTLAAAVGAAKGRWVLAPRARANVQRIADAPGRQSLFLFFSPLAWGLVVAMMVLGWVLRHSGLSRGVLGPVYAAVGSALMVGAGPSWRSWRKMGESMEEGS